MQLTHAQTETIKSFASLFPRPLGVTHCLLYRLHKVERPITDEIVQRVIHSYLGVAPRHLLDPIAIIVYPRLGAPAIREN